MYDGDCWINNQEQDEVKRRPVVNLVIDFYKFQTVNNNIIIKED